MKKIQTHSLPISRPLQTRSLFSRTRSQTLRNLSQSLSSLTLSISFSLSISSSHQKPLSRVRKKSMAEQNKRAHLRTFDGNGSSGNESPSFTPFKRFFSLIWEFRVFSLKPLRRFSFSQFFRLIRVSWWSPLFYLGFSFFNLFSVLTPFFFILTALGLQRISKGSNGEKLQKRFCGAQSWSAYFDAIFRKGNLHFSFLLRFVSNPKLGNFGIYCLVN